MRFSKKKILRFLRIEMGGVTEVYDWQDSGLLLIFARLEARTIISHLNFHVFEFFHRELTFWDSLYKSFRELPECQFGSTFEITTASCDNSILDLNPALERILSVLLIRNKSFLLSFTHIAVICSQGPLKCCFYFKIPISGNSTFTAKICMKNVFPKIDTIFFWTPKTL